MILQKIVLPESSEMEKSLYYRGNFRDSFSGNKMIVLARQEILDLITYFNSFSAGKWWKYTRVKHLISLWFLRSHSMAVYHKKIFNGTVVTSVIHKFELESALRVSRRLFIGELPTDGIIGLVLTSKLDGTEIYDGYYGTSDILKVDDIHVGIGICTFKREEYVKRNMNLLRREILDNENALSYGHYSVCISDNAQTLQSEEFFHPNIRLVTNKNLGGVGGFTRAMVECLNSEKEYTHMLLMDDDAMISPDIIERKLCLFNITEI